MRRVAPKHQRLLLAGAALLAVAGAGLSGAYALQNRASYFYLPAQMMADPPAATRAVRLGGMVERGSLRREADGITIAFTVADDRGGRVPVRYRGIAPDLFVEGSGVVAEGRLGPDGVFLADNLLARHDENYVPRELKDMHVAGAPGGAGVAAAARR
ncbi:cytochrome c maturation protein CcmE [Erythrobacteraceae bacterium CFH 75059]|uniref:cytochrome c maturation protein CcmE n=1 Tax=Qipengyuania thermophila TaxID=2509361 RepID=UPI001021AEC3|nr:cytochrome c maturation protein CcmE [Qipengyuania thermophila]TCD05027.1 cytochrome c maturation protein CcmE [Erythrobacteraceae bacterium CFH 75059]